MYKTHFTRYEQLRNDYIAAVSRRLDSPQRQQLLPQISSALQACLRLTTLPQAKEISQALKIFAQDYLKPYDFNSLSATASQKPDRAHLLICIFLNELRLGATETAWLMHRHPQQYEAILAADQLSLANDFLAALVDFAQINIYSSRLLSTSDSDWPNKVKAYQTPLSYILHSLQHFDQLPIAAELDFSAVEKVYIDHSLDICRSALQTQHMDEAHFFLKALADMLKRIPKGYGEARNQARNWSHEFFPNLLHCFEAPVSSPAKTTSHTEANRRKKENSQLAGWTKTVQDLPIEAASIQRLKHILSQVSAKTCEREAFQHRKQQLEQLIDQKLKAIEAQKPVPMPTPSEQYSDPAVPPNGHQQHTVVSERLNRHSYQDSFIDHHPTTVDTLSAQPCASEPPASLPPSVNAKPATSLGETRVHSTTLNTQALDLIFTETPASPANKKAPSASKLARKAFEQQFGKFSHIEAQINAFSAQPDELLSLKQLEADLSQRQQAEKNVSVLAKIAKLRMHANEKLTQLMASPQSLSLAIAAEPPILPPTNELTSPENGHPKPEQAVLGFIHPHFKPVCLHQPAYRRVFKRLTQMAQRLDKEFYLYGSAIYKAQPNDLDLLLPLPNIEVLSALLSEGAQTIGEFKKEQRHVVQLLWHGVKLDVNLTDKTWQQHAAHVDFTVGATYYNFRQQQSSALHAEVFDHIRRHELHCSQVRGSLAMLQHDPSILFRAMRLENLEGYRWSDEFNHAVYTLAQQAANPFFMNPNKLYYEMVKLFTPGQACANLARLIQLNLFEKLFARLAELNDSQKHKAYSIIWQAARASDTFVLPSSFMYYAIHWSWLNQCTSNDRHQIANQSQPRIELQVGPPPLWNIGTHHFNRQWLNHYDDCYERQRLQPQPQAIQSRAWHQQPPCHTSTQQRHQGKKSAYAPLNINRFHSNL